MDPYDNLKAEEHLKAAEEQGLDNWSTSRAELNDKRFKIIEGKLEQMSINVEWLKSSVAQHDLSDITEKEESKKNSQKQIFYSKKSSRTLLGCMRRMLNLKD